jgi:hypothetical protein
MLDEDLADLDAFQRHLATLLAELRDWEPDLLSTT